MAEQNKPEIGVVDDHDPDNGSNPTVTNDEDTPTELPPVDSLTAESDFTPFMKADVDEATQQLALRKLWRTDPIFANLDGLNDYDWDFRAGMTGQLIRTAYQIGKGFLEHVPEEEVPEQDMQEAEHNLAEDDQRDEDVG